MKNDKLLKQYIMESSENKKDSIITNLFKGLKEYTSQEKIALFILCATPVNVAILTLSYIISFINLQKVVFTNNVLYIAISLCIPILAWVYATDSKYMAFHIPKMRWFLLVITNGIMTVCQPLFTLIWKIAVVPVCQISPGVMLTKKMIILLAYVIVAAIATIIAIICYSTLYGFTKSESLWTKIKLFKLSHIYDKRRDKDCKYDMISVKDLETGYTMIVKESDRFVHLLIDGQSGTGKTSSVFIPTISNDLQVRRRNRERKEKAYLRMILEGKATIRGPLIKFEEDAVIAIGKTERVRKKNEKELASIRKRFVECGITCIAPNNGVIEDIIKLALANGIDVNVADAVNDYPYENVKKVGLQPFFVPLNLEEAKRVIHISSAASVFSDVLIAVNQTGGSSDTYFTDIALATSSNIAMIIMLAKNIRGQQTMLDDVLMAINNFSLLKDYVAEIEAYYNIEIPETQIASSRGKTVSALSGEDLSRTSNSTRMRKDTIKNPYMKQLVFVKNELLGPGSEKMYDQARGLRNLCNKIFQDPRVLALFSADEENSINFDRMLAKSEITLVNTSMELGKNVSTTIGLFFMLLQKNAVLRRPLNHRPIHMVWTDEATQYMHPAYEDMYALYRQYGVIVAMAVQSLAQTEKNPSTAYLKDIMMGAGTHIVFGRLSTTEMELYSKMAGTEKMDVEQQTYTQSSIFSENPSMTESVRITPTLVNVKEGSEMRHLDFQEVTFFTINNGRVLHGKLGRVFFVKKADFENKVEKQIDWKKVVPEAFDLNASTEQSAAHENNPVEHRNLPTTENYSSNEIHLERELNFIVDEKIISSREEYFKDKTDSATQPIPEESKKLTWEMLADMLDRNTKQNSSADDEDTAELSIEQLKENLKKYGRK